MIGVGSIATAKNKKVFHRMNCMYAKRIKCENRMEMNSVQARNGRYCTCKYCGGLKGELRVSQRKLDRWEKKNRMQFFYDDKSDTLYIRTEMGCWKVFMSEDINKYLLYHKNKFDSTMSMEDAMWGEFHRQKDVKATESLEKLVEYIIAHDKAKQIIAIDYRMLPQTTKRQKRYYRAAKKKAKKQETRRVKYLFMSLEKENTELLKLSIC